MVVEQHYDWSKDDYWQRRRLSPAQLLIHDINFSSNPPAESERSNAGPLLEINEILVSTLLPALAERNQLSDSYEPDQWTAKRQEQQHLGRTFAEFGWMNCLRREKESSSSTADKCRWM